MSATQANDRYPPRKPKFKWTDSSSFRRLQDHPRALAQRQPRVRILLDGGMKGSVPDQDEVALATMFLDVRICPPQRSSLYLAGSQTCRQLHWRRRAGRACAAARYSFG